MMEIGRGQRYRFGVFEVDPAAGELRRQGLRVRLPPQPFQVLCLLLQRPGVVLTREEICRELWPDGTFVDYEHGVNAAVNRLREALRDRASDPRYVETLPRRGYRFVGSVETVGEERAPGEPQVSGSGQGTEREQGERQSPFESDSRTGQDAVVRQGVRSESWLTTPEVLPRLPGQGARVLFLLLQGMYLLFAVGVLANLAEVQEIVDVAPGGQGLFVAVAALAACCIPLRLYLLGLAGLRPPRAEERFLRLWPLLLGVDLLGALSPLLLVHHVSFGLALACVCPLVYAPFAERSLVLMGAVGAVGSRASAG